MRLAELSERSGVSTATIKYYLREQLLPPGRRISATQAEYGEEHLRRLRLVRALIQVGRVPVATAREVLAAVEDESLDQNLRMGAAVWALPHGSAPKAGQERAGAGRPREAGADEDEDEDDPAVVTARAEVDRLLVESGWGFSRDLGAVSPAYRMLVTAVAALVRLGYPCDAADLAPYAELAARLAVTDLDLVETYPTPVERVEAAVALTVLYEPVLLSLRRMAEAEESHRRFATD